MDHFSTLPINDCLSSIFLKLDILELRRLEFLCRRFRALITDPEFDNLYRGLGGSRSIWHVTHGLDYHQHWHRPHNQWVTLRREEDDKTLTVPFVVGEQEMQLVSVWNVNCLFIDRPNGFVLYDVLTRRLDRVNYHDFYGQHAFHEVYARQLTRLIADPDDGRRVLFGFFHPQGNNGLRFFSHSTATGEQSFIPSTLVNGLNDQDVANALWTVIPNVRFFVGGTFLAATRDHLRQPVHSFHPSEAIEGHFMSGLPPEGMRLTRRDIFYCNRGYIVAVDQLLDQDLLPAMAKRKIVGVSFGRLLGDRYELVSTMPDDLLPEDDSIQMEGQTLKLLDDDVINFSFVIVHAHHIDPMKMESVIMRYNLHDRQWSQIRTQMRLEKPLVLCTRLR